MPENPKMKKTGADEIVPNRLRTKVVAIEPVLHPKTAMDVAWLKTLLASYQDKTFRKLLSKATL